MTEEAVTLLTSIAVAGAACMLLAAVVGYMLSKGMGAVFFAGLTFFAFAICLGIVAALSVGGVSPFWSAVIGVIICGLIGILFGYLLFKRRGLVIIPLFWFGFWALFLLGYQIGGWIGLLTITLPAILSFWATIVILAGWFLLPLPGGKQRLEAIRSVLTFCLGTNYPYFIIEGREPVLRVPGNQFEAFFAGPGIILTGCEHTVAIWDGMYFKRVPDPGLSFTYMFESIQAAVDLRPQLRSFFVEALTKDGIPIKVLTFIPFRIDHGVLEPSIGDSFPFRKRAVFQAVHARPVELRREGKGMDEVEVRERKRWDELVPLMAASILKTIIAEYTFDQLYEPFDPRRDPRVEIRTRLRETLQAAVAPWGITLEGGGISNLMPQDPSALEARIENWRIEWARRMIVTLSQGEAEALRLEEGARAAAYADLIQQISAHFEGLDISGQALSANVIASRFVDAMAEMSGNQLVRRSLPDEVIKTLDYLQDAVRRPRLQPGKGT